ncbi:hypothetical protein OCH239_12605 [Roseivivax halodurans JCM 10272]|uniref:Uncharacterized protein n=1 Tax=Roseivivax halodurans JCM 10272 TaxID=1449350 RepID=X7EDS0_9RHOB|nr:hypothetical protein [Roseivivax halodurans]ETX13273.1 hypothetical protein OCH239_12605 [Roseivivax halodurans JCM 10272]
MFGQGMFLNPANATPEDIQRKREALQAILDGEPRPQSAGAGLAHAAADIVGAFGQRKLDKVERLGRAGATAEVSNALGKNASAFGESVGAFGAGGGASGFGAGLSGLFSLFGGR